MNTQTIFGSLQVILTGKLSNLHLNQLQRRNNLNVKFNCWSMFVLQLVVPGEISLKFFHCYSNYELQLLLELVEQHTLDPLV